jgi:hypothetical protein
LRSAEKVEKLGPKEREHMEELPDIFAELLAEGTGCFD